MLNISADPSFAGRKWWTEITNQPVAHPGEKARRGMFSPEDFIGYLEELATEAESAVAIAKRRAASEKGLECFMLNAACQAALGRCYAERTRAALALFEAASPRLTRSGAPAGGSLRAACPEAVAHMEKALEHYRQMVDLDNRHRKDFCFAADGSAIGWEWGGVISALEAELSDARAGQFKPGSAYLTQRPAKTA